MVKRSWFVLVASTVAACGSSPSGSTPSDGGSLDSSTPQTVDAGDASDAGDAGTTVTVTTEAGTVTITPLGNVAQNVSSAGATVSLGRASLVVPAGALTQSTTLTIAADSVQPAGAAATTVYEFGPEGLTFAIPATVNLPATAGVVHWSQVASGTTFFTDLPTTLAGGLATAPVTHFSRGYVAAASQPSTIEVCQLIEATGITGCPTGYSCGGGACAHDLSVGICGGYSPMLGPTQYLGEFPILCVSDSPSPADGGVSVVAEGGLVRCGDAGNCIDLQTDGANCGACGHACAAGQGCHSGTCAARCGGGATGVGNCGADCSGCAGTVACGASCTNTQYDPGNCGACGHACASGQACTAGACVPICAGGGVCTADGYCATTCPTGSAACGAAGSSTMTATCVDLQADPLHCGTCGHACGAGQGCNQGTCTATCFRGGNGVGGNCGADCSGCPGTVACGASCTDTQTDPGNCGACGQACASGQICTGGGCVPLCAGGGVCTSSGYCATACPAGSALCGDAGTGGTTSTSFCSDEQTDALHCGGCDTACPGGQTCVAGACQPVCATGNTGATGTGGASLNGP